MILETLENGGQLLPLTELAMMEDLGNSLSIRMKSNQMEVIAKVLYVFSIFTFVLSFKGSSKFSFLRQNIGRIQPSSTPDENLEDELEDELTEAVSLISFFF
jgi:hypothetical protein